MKDYGRFITFIIFLTAGILGLNSLFPNPTTIYGYTLPSPLFSLGTIALIISFVFVAWDKLIWKLKLHPFPQLGFLFGFHDYPNLNGKWIISYESSYKYDEQHNRYTTKGEGSANIKQSYSDLYVDGIFGESSGFESFMSKLQRKENGKWFLVYAYKNIPKDIKLKSSPNGGTHEGFCYLDINKSGKEMTGYYSNDEQRKTRGSIKFKKAK